MKDWNLTSGLLVLYGAFFKAKPDGFALKSINGGAVWK